jgi:hypothetical protein
VKGEMREEMRGVMWSDRRVKSGSEWSGEEWE